MLAFLLPLFLLNIRKTGDKIFNYKIFRAAISTLKKKKKERKFPGKIVFVKNTKL